MALNKTKQGKTVSCPGEVEILPVASCYRNRDKLLRVDQINELEISILMFKYNQGSTLTAARLPGATKNFIGATKFQILVCPIGQLKIFVTVVG